jgi:hypothetical protein
VCADFSPLSMRRPASSSGKRIRFRRRTIIDVAHPNCREELLAAAKRLGYVLPEQYLASQAAYPVHEERTVRLKSEFAREIVELGLDLILTQNTPTTAAMLQQTRKPGRLHCANDARA